MATSKIHKICSKCGVELSISEFHCDSSKPDGHHPWCKSCRLMSSRRRRGVTQDRYFSKLRKPGFVPLEGKASARWYQAHAETERKRAHEKRKNNPEPFRAANRRWRERNIEIARERVRKYQRENPHALAFNAAQRRAVKLRATPSWANGFFISETYRLASLRTNTLGVKWVVDHIVPLRSSIVCGLHVEHNLRVIPESVNAAKGNRYWPDMPNGGDYRY